MTDIMSKEKRSKLMSKIKSSNTGIERLILQEFKRRKMKKFLYQPKMSGNPDFVFLEPQIAIFCDGDFWHGYKFNSWKIKLNKFWYDKISKNIQRDKKIKNHLKKEGWIVIRLWGHEIKKDTKKCVDKIQKVVEDRNEA